MTPRFCLLTEKKLIGKRQKMSISNDMTIELWRKFMPERGKIRNVISNEFYSMQVYSPEFNFNAFDPGAEFENGRQWKSLILKIFPLGWTPSF